MPKRQPTVSFLFSLDNISFHILFHILLPQNKKQLIFFTHVHNFTGILPDKPHYLYFTVDLAPTSPAVVGNTKEDTAKAKKPEPEVIPPRPLEQNNKTKGTKLPKHTQQTKLNATQSSVLTQLVTLEQ